MRLRRRPETIAGRVNADGTIAGGEGFSVSKTGTGAYTIFLPRDFRLVSATVTVLAGSAWTATAANYAATQIGVLTFVSNTAAAGDAPFMFTAVGA